MRHIWISIMVISSASLGFFGGGASAAPSTPAIGTFKRYQRDQVAARTDFMERADVQREIAYFKKAAAKVTEVDDLIEDRRLLTFVATAFGLESEIRAPGKLRAVLKSDINDINSYANRLRDPRFGELARFFDTETYGMAQIRISSKQDKLTQDYLTNAFERDMGQQNPALRDALFFLRKINDVTTTYDIMGDSALRRIVSDTLDIPLEVARQSLNTQINLFERKLPLDRLTLTGGGGSGSSIAARRDADLAKIAEAGKLVDGARAQLDALSTTLESLRGEQTDLVNVTDVAGVNAGNIAVQLTAMPDLVRQAGLIGAADAGVTSARGHFNTLMEIYDAAGTTTDAGVLADLQADFESTATSLASALTDASYDGDNLLTGAASDIATVIDTDGTELRTSFGDLTDFFNDLGAARTSFGALTVATIDDDLGTVLTNLNAAEAGLSASEVTHQINAANLTRASGDVVLAQSLNTQELTLGYDAILDAQARSAEIRTIVGEISVLAEQAQGEDADLTAINNQYADLQTRLNTAITVAGSVTSDGTTITFDNLLNGDTQSRRLFNDADDVGGVHTVTAAAANLTSSFTTLTSTYPTITAANASDLADTLTDYLSNGLTNVDFNLARDQRAFEFAVGTADPQGRLDQVVRNLERTLDDVISAAGLGGHGLLSPYGSDISIVTQSTYGNLRVEARNDFRETLSDAISAFRRVVLEGGDSAARTNALNDMVIAIGSANSALTVERQTLDLQSAILDGAGDSAAGDDGFLKPLENSTFAIKFIEQYLVRKDAEMAGAKFGAATASGGAAIKAALIGTIRPLQPPIGGRINLLL